MTNASDEALNEIKEIGLKAAWHAANNRKGNEDERRDKQEFEQAAENLKNSGYFTESLVNDIKWCAWNLAWMNTNRNVGNSGKAGEDQHRANRHCWAMIGGMNGELID